MKSLRLMMVQGVLALLLLAGCGGPKETTATTSSGGGEETMVSGEPVVWSLAENPVLAAPPGGVITVRLRAEVASGVRLYTDREYGGLDFTPVPTTVELKPQTIYGSTGDMVADEGSIQKIDPHFGEQQLEYWVGTATISVPITLAENAATGTYDAKVVINYMSCTDKVCYPPKTATVPLTVKVTRR